MHAYNDTDDKAVTTFGRVHGNGEQTHVAILSCGESHYAAVAYDVNPGQFDAVAGECIAFDPTLDGVTQRAERWMEKNPKGVAYQDGSEGGESGGRNWTQTILDMLGKLNDYGNQQREQMQQNQGGK